MPSEDRGPIRVAHRQVDPIEGYKTTAKYLKKVRAGQFIYSRLFAFEGSYAYVPAEFDGYFVSGEYPTFLCDPERVNVEFLYAYFRSPSVWAQIAAGSKGPGVRRQRVQAGTLLAHEIILPPLDYQEEVASLLRDLSKGSELHAHSEHLIDELRLSLLRTLFRTESRSGAS